MSSEPIEQFPTRGAAIRLLESASLPSADLTDSHMKHFFYSGSAAKPTGLIGVEFCGQEALLRSLAVAEERRGAGLGSALVTRAEAYARACDARSIFLLTTTAEDFSEAGAMSLLSGRVRLRPFARRESSQSSVLPAPYSSSNRSGIERHEGRQSAAGSLRRAPQRSVRRCYRPAESAARELGAPRSGYSDRSKYEKAERYFTGSTPATGSGRTPLQDLHGIITPSSLHFERHHSGIPDINPRTTSSWCRSRRQAARLYDGGPLPLAFRLAHPLHRMRRQQRAGA